MHITPGVNRNSKGTVVFVSISLYRLLNRVCVQVYVTLVYQYATLAFTSVLMCVNLRPVFLCMTSAFALFSGHYAHNCFAAIILAHLMSTNVVSSTVLIRSFLPPVSHVFITFILGRMEFTYFPRWFDVIFSAAPHLLPSCWLISTGKNHSMYLSILTRLIISQTL